MKEGYIKQEDRKKILLLTDDVRVHSGVAHIGRELILNSCHRYNWVNLAGAVKHPEKNQVIDLSQEWGEKSSTEDASIKLYCTDGYGNEEILREVIKQESPDAILLITDPRYFAWVFQMEDELRKEMPIAYLNIWDDMPAPQYNEEFYESCDALFGISKQTVAINKIVLGDKAKSKVIKYIPHGLDKNVFKPLENISEEYNNFKKELTQNIDRKFILLFNSRNIRRKQIPDTLIAWKMFLDTLTPEQQEECLLVLHTEVTSQHGTDLQAVVEYLFGPNSTNVIISSRKLPQEQMNWLYNIADGVILISSAEGWGLSLTESLLTGTPIIANTTGGMQDQMRFVDDEGNWYTNDQDVPSNHNATYTKHGVWALPVYPKAISMVGSPATPYIFDSRANIDDVAERIKQLYGMSPESRKAMGALGMEWALGDEAGFTSEKMGERFVEGMEELFSTWSPREKFEFYADTDFKPRTLNHKISY